MRSGSIWKFVSEFSIPIFFTGVAPAAEANPDYVRDRALEEIGLVIPFGLNCSNDSLDPDAPIAMPLICHPADHSGWVYVRVDDDSDLDITAASGAFPHNANWVEIDNLSPPLPVRWGFDPGWIYHPEVAGRETLCARIQARDVDPDGPPDIGARCFTEYSNLGGAPRVISIEFIGFEVSGSALFFDTIRPEVRAVVETRIEVVALGLQLVAP